MKTLFEQPHFIFSVESPMYPPKIKPPTHQQAIDWLKAQGEDVISAAGHYGNPEPSIIVRNPKNVEGLKQLAADIGQESVIHSDGKKHQFIYLNGPKKGTTVYGEGTEIHATPPLDNYTSFKDQTGDQVHFSHMFDFPQESLGKSEDLHKAALMPNQKARDIADQYAASKNIKLNHPQGMAIVDPSFSTKVANEYGKMAHTPNDPETKKSYDAFIGETKDQFNHIKQSGLKISKIKPGMPNPYKSSSDLHNDVKNNNHMWFYPTESGFGTDNKISDHPMLQPTEEIHEGKPLLANDMFRIVHDYFGHVKDGTGFGPNGEETAYRSHAQMYTPLARKALASESRGQTSFVNFGPNAEHNRTNPSNTIYAEQKAGLMPDWTHDIKLGKSEDLIKTPFPYNDYSSRITQQIGLPDFVNHDDYRQTKITKLPNGLEYRQFAHKGFPSKIQKKAHALYDPSDLSEPLAYMETENEEGNTPKGFHPHAVQLSEVHPSHRGKGLGRQLYLATLVHGTRKLTSDENVSPEAHRMWHDLNKYPGLGGHIAPTPSNERHNIFISHPEKLDHNKMFPPVDLNDKLIRSEVDESDLKKSVDNKSWDRITTSHNKASQDPVVDAEAHVTYFNKVHPTYANEVLHSEKVHPPVPLKAITKGSTSKMLHDASDGRYMSKPYHSHTVQAIKKWAKHPIKGWANLTANRLFHAGGIPELADDVSAHIHKGVPMVVSKFNPEAVESIGRHEPYSPPDVAKILVMDHLMHNQDRHAGNIMSVDHTPIAIDNELGFQYHGPKWGNQEPPGSPFDSLKNSGFSYKNEALPKQMPEISEHMVDWWNKNGQNIKKELENNLQFIKDRDVQNHIRDNFNQRWEQVNDAMTHQPEALFSPNLPKVDNIPFRKKKK